MSENSEKMTIECIENCLKAHKDKITESELDKESNMTGNSKFKEYLLKILKCPNEHHLYIDADGDEISITCVDDTCDFVKDERIIAHDVFACN